MSDELFEVAFSGKINDGADLDEVKVRVAKIFNADDAKLAHLFSGKRVVIKKNIDSQTATKYQTTLERAGAKCEILSLSAGDEVTRGPDLKPEGVSSPPSSSSIPSEPTDESSAPPPVVPVQATVYETTDHGDVSPPPQTDPLGISGDQIEDLSATIAPVGSELQGEIKEVVAPAIDVSDLEIAPVGSELGSGKKDPDPPPPDTSGISMAD